MNWVFFLVLADLVLLPMLHFGPIPYKFSYLVLAIGFGRIAFHGNSFRFFFVMFFSLAVVTAMGWMIYANVTSSYVLDTTFTIISIYLYAPLALMYGSRLKKDHLRVVPYVILMYFVANMLVIKFWANLLGTRFGELYGYTGNILGAGDTQGRAGGLHENPNVSALFMTVLLVLLYIAIKRGSLRIQSPVVILALIAALMLPVILSSRAETVSVLLILVALSVISVKRISASGLFISVIGLFVVIFVVYIAGSTVLGLTQNPVERLQDNYLDIVNENMFDQYDGLGRFVVSWHNSNWWERFQVSPVFGTGGERAFYHNDWVAIIVSAGVVGFIIFIVLVIALLRIDLIFIVPFVISGMSNSFVLTPQHFMIAMIAAGVAWRYTPRRSARPRFGRPVALQT